ncbi:helix-turn-helix domain-containing protein [Klebsiella sp. CN_Kp098]|uniref:helix-turn-helix domain-containing protein n=1 Tax=unclassified Klebsiella TaxID=2608929 RepID=UPI0032B58464
MTLSRLPAAGLPADAPFTSGLTTPDFSPARPVPRPEAVIQRLIQALLPHGRALRTRSTCPLGPDTPVVYLLTQGNLDMLRITDGLVLTTVHAPYVIGLANLLQPGQAGLLAQHPDSRMLRVGRDKVLRILEETPSLWTDVAHLLAYALQFAGQRDRELTTSRAYDTVCGKLMELMHAPAAFRESTSVLNFIQRRTPLSRSVVALILRDLRAGEYITMRQGRLVSVQHLPAEY